MPTPAASLTDRRSSRRVETHDAWPLKSRVGLGRIDMDGDGGIHFRHNMDHVDAGKSGTTWSRRLALTLQLFNETWMGN